MRREERSAPAGVSGSLGEYWERLEDKRSSGPTPEEINLERYQGKIRLRDSKSGEYLKNPDGSLRYKVTPQSRAEGCILFVKEVIGVEYIKPYQERIIRRFYTSHRRRYAVRAPRGAGKSAVSAWIILHFGSVHEYAKILTTAGSWDQLEHFLWPDINRWYNQARWELIGKRPKMNLLDFSFGGSEDGKVKPTVTAFAIKSEESQKMEGAHAPHVLILVDEAKSVPDGTWDAIEGTLAQGDKWILAGSTPGPPTGRFADIHRKRGEYDDWEVDHITYQDRVEGINDPQERADYLAWAAKRKQQWGEESALYRNHVLAEFADIDDSAIIPLEWVEQANRRWKDWEEAGFPETDEWCGDIRIRTQGADIAGQGKDDTAISKRIGHCIREIIRERKGTMHAVNQMCVYSRHYPNINVETDGPGVGVWDRLHEIVEEDDEKPDEEKRLHGVELFAIRSGSKSEETEKSGQLGFLNKRSELWWKMREMLDPDSGIPIRLPPDPLLIEDLTTPKWGLLGIKINVEKKEEIRKRLKGRSTDTADAVIFSMASDGTSVVIETIRVLPDDDVNGMTIYDVESPFGERMRSMWGERC